MEAAEVRSRRPEDDEPDVPVQRFVVIVGEPADGGSAFRIEDPARLLRVWSLLQATLEQLEKVTLPPEEMPGLQRQLQVVRRELERAVSPPLAAERCGTEHGHVADRVRGAGELGRQPGRADARRVRSRARAVAADQRGRDRR